MTGQDSIHLPATGLPLTPPATPEKPNEPPPTQSTPSEGTQAPITSGRDADGTKTSARRLEEPRTPVRRGRDATGDTQTSIPSSRDTANGAQIRVASGEHDVNGTKTPTLSGKHATANRSSIDASIIKLIKEPARLDHAKGRVYVLSAVRNGTKLIKIGYTTQDNVEERIRQIKANCQARGDDEGFTFSDQSPYTIPVNSKSYCKRIERLVHAELRNHRCKFLCRCGKYHREYFAVDEAVASGIVARWVRFLEQKPYAEEPSNAQLLAEWDGRLAWFKQKLDDAKTTPDAEGEWLARWQEFVDVPLWHWVEYDLREMWSKFRWQLCLVVLCVWDLLTAPRGVPWVYVVLTALALLSMWESRFFRRSRSWLANGLKVVKRAIAILITQEAADQGVRRNTPEHTIAEARLERSSPGRLVEDKDSVEEAQTLPLLGELFQWDSDGSSGEHAVEDRRVSRSAPELENEERQSDLDDATRQ
ncbi:hypothetical protein N656DRAFT_772991 [Canariomyces notabilis]|uniref:Bacteriophage T5 Orf172 DNA-binding domain-containing protein n=1 Tax=Canariomyces notabilis TaxID=2074819 RepID=A0AAN6TM32_9PEZI|nr:hypothetical protein N656DRAFT_772991 [Canariomyces arenarius]